MRLFEEAYDEMLSLMEVRLTPKTSLIKVSSFLRCLVKATLDRLNCEMG
jgi:hypothetical protein